MTECPNGEIRDLLPELLHGALDGATRSRVEAHVAECVSCREELALLRQVQALAPRVRVDVARIVSALPAPELARWRAWSSHAWQIAAAVVFMAAGGTLVARQMRRAPDADRTRPAVVASTYDSAVGGTATGDVELSVGYDYSELTDAQLQALLKDVEHMSAVPMAEPDASVPAVTVTNGGV